MIHRAVWIAFHDLFNKFCVATGMMEKYTKSCIYYEKEGDNEVSKLVKEICEVFNFQNAPLGEWFKYLGFMLKPNNYSAKD